jgi:hypothetical protein
MRTAFDLIKLAVLASLFYMVARCDSHLHDKYELPQQTKVQQ